MKCQICGVDNRFNECDHYKIYLKPKAMTTNQKALMSITASASVTEKTIAVGGGEWSLEVYADGVFVCEYVGSNGTHEQSDDLWAQYRADWKTISKAF